MYILYICILYTPKTFNGSLSSNRLIIILAFLMYSLLPSPSGNSLLRQLVKALMRTQLEHTVAQRLAKESILEDRMRCM